ncbi:putative transcription repressor [Nymphaea thermarum]|nr:putative transcription repressor [Nymphaea thermarum]
MDFGEASSRQRKLKAASQRRRRRRRNHYTGHRSVTGYGGFCCRCRLISISSPEETEPDSSEKPDSLSAVIHTMVLERLEEQIREMQKPAERKADEKKEPTNLTACRNRGVKRVAASAVEKVSLDPRKDLRESMLEMIRSNQMEQPRELRRLLECFLSLNSDECGSHP